MSVSLCVQIGLSGVKEGLSAGGGDAALLSINLYVIWASHTHIQFTHTSEETPLLCSYSRNYFVINTLIQTLCCVVVYLCCLDILF